MIAAALARWRAARADRACTRRLMADIAQATAARHALGRAARRART